jgi:hypothetical protein
MNSKKELIYNNLPFTSKLLVWIMNLILASGLFWLLAIILKGIMRTLGSC